jgi:pimeloyl-ACP methyl ester carboxylesterase
MLEYIVASFYKGELFLAAYEIDQIRKVELGGVKQKIHIRGQKLRNPVLLFLHGGPGISNRDSVMNRHADLTDDFTLVAWDQRGTGGSYWGVTKESLNLEQLISDAAQLVEYLCSSLGKQKLYIWGGSWGTELGTYLCHRYPQHIAAYIGSGQMVNGTLNEELSYDFAMTQAQKAGDAESVAILERIGRPVNGCYREIFDGMMAQRRVMKKYGGHSMKKGTYWTDTALPLLKSKEFSFTDKIGLALGYKKCLTYMWPTTIQCDFTTECTQFDVPYYIFQGAHDNNTPSALVQSYFDAIQAPDKALIWFEHSAHGPLGEEPERYKRLMREKLLQWEA